MKKPVLNLMLIYSKKAGDNMQIIRQAINLAENPNAVGSRQWQGCQAKFA